MRTFYNEEWDFTICYPADWCIVYENEPTGAWIIPIAVASSDTGDGRAVFTVNARREEILQSSAGLRALGVRMSTPQEYLEWNKQELERSLAGYQFISEEKTRLADQPVARLVYSYSGQGKRMMEEAIALFSIGMTFRFICKAPPDRYAELYPCFQRIVDSFRIGRDRPEEIAATQGRR